jgi:hypothetical protein
MYVAAWSPRSDCSLPCPANVYPCAPLSSPIAVAWSGESIRATRCEPGHVPWACIGAAGPS